MSKTKKYLFSLNINLEMINRKYGFSETLIDDENTKNVTKLEDLEINNKKNLEIVSFLDESKKINKCYLSKINFDYPYTRYKCFWDRNYIPEGVIPIGCPLRYIPSRITKTYFSEISKEKYSITESVTNKKLKNVQEKGDDRYSFENKDYYETEGVFCSFNCCMAFIFSPENKKDSKYAYSEALLLKMYSDTCQAEKTQEILPAPDWRLLEEFGGHLTIEKFRDSFNKIVFLNRGIVSCVSLGLLFEDKIKF